MPRSLSSEKFYSVCSFPDRSQFLPEEHEDQPSPKKHEEQVDISSLLAIPASMQAAFDESIRDADARATNDQASSDDGRASDDATSGEDPLDRLITRRYLDNAYDPSGSSNPRMGKHHPLLKLVAQIIFGLQLLCHKQARSAAEAIRILENHVRSIDHFLNRTREDVERANEIASKRIPHFQRELLHLSVSVQTAAGKDADQTRKEMLEWETEIRDIVRKTTAFKNTIVRDLDICEDVLMQLRDYLDSVMSSDAAKWLFPSPATAFGSGNSSSKVRNSRLTTDDNMEEHDVPVAHIVEVFTGMRTNEEGWLRASQEFAGKLVPLDYHIQQLVAWTNSVCDQREFSAITRNDNKAGEHHTSNELRSRSEDDHMMQKKTNKHHLRSPSAPLSSINRHEPTLARLTSQLNQHGDGVSSIPCQHRRTNTTMGFPSLDKPLPRYPSNASESSRSRPVTLSKPILSPPHPIPFDIRFEQPREEAPFPPDIAMRKRGTQELSQHASGMSSKMSTDLENDDLPALSPIVAPADAKGNQSFLARNMSRLSGQYRRTQSVSHGRQEPREARVAEVNATHDLAAFLRSSGPAPWNVLNRTEGAPKAKKASASDATQEIPAARAGSDAVESQEESYDIPIGISLPSPRLMKSFSAGLGFGTRPSTAGALPTGRKLLRKNRPETAVPVVENAEPAQPLDSAYSSFTHDDLARPDVGNGQDEPAEGFSLPESSPVTSRPQSFYSRRANVPRNIMTSDSQSSAGTSTSHQSQAPNPYLQQFHEGEISPITSEEHSVWMTMTAHAAGGRSLRVVSPSPPSPLESSVPELQSPHMSYRALPGHDFGALYLSNGADGDHSAGESSSSLRSVPSENSSVLNNRLDMTAHHMVGITHNEDHLKYRNMGPIGEHSADASLATLPRSDFGTLGGDACPAVDISTLLPSAFSSDAYVSPWSLPSHDSFQRPSTATVASSTANKTEADTQRPSTSSAVNFLKRPSTSSIITTTITGGSQRSTSNISTSNTSRRLVRKNGLPPLNSIKPASACFPVFEPNCESLGPSTTDKPNSSSSSILYPFSPSTRAFTFQPPSTAASANTSGPLSPGVTSRPTTAPTPRLLRSATAPISTQQIAPAQPIPQPPQHSARLPLDPLPEHLFSRTNVLENQAADNKQKRKFLSKKRITLGIDFKFGGLMKWGRNSSGGESGTDGNGEEGNGDLRRSREPGIGRRSNGNGNGRSVSGASSPGFGMRLGRSTTTTLT
jgi:hypothetical protein